MNVGEKTTRQPRSLQTLATGMILDATIHDNINLKIRELEFTPIPDCEYPYDRASKVETGHHQSVYVLHALPMAPRIANEEFERPLCVHILELNCVISLDLLSLFHAVGFGWIMPFKDNPVGFEVIRDR